MSINKLDWMIWNAKQDLELRYIKSRRELNHAADWAWLSVRHAIRKAAEAAMQEVKERA